MSRQNRNTSRKRANQRNSDNAESLAQKFLDAANGYLHSNRDSSNRTKFGTLVTIALEAGFATPNSLGAYGITKQDIGKAKKGITLSDIDEDTRTRFITDMTAKAKDILGITEEEDDDADYIGEDWGNPYKRGNHPR